MTIEELEEKLRKGASRFTENSENKNEIELNPKEITKEEDKTEEKPREIKIRFIKKINP